MQLPPLDFIKTLRGGVSFISQRTPSEIEALGNTLPEKFRMFIDDFEKTMTGHIERIRSLQELIKKGESGVEEKDGSIDIIGWKREVCAIIRKPIDGFPVWTAKHGDSNEDVINVIVKMYQACPKWFSMFAGFPLLPSFSR